MHVKNEWFASGANFTWYFYLLLLKFANWKSYKKKETVKSTIGLACFFSHRPTAKESFNKK